MALEGWETLLALLGVGHLRPLGNKQDGLRLELWKPSGQHRETDQAGRSPNARSRTECRRTAVNAAPASGHDTASSLVSESACGHSSAIY